ACKHDAACRSSPSPAGGGSDCIERSEMQSGVGCRRIQKGHPTPTTLAARARSTLPLQGRVKRVPDIDAVPGLLLSSSFHSVPRAPMKEIFRQFLDRRRQAGELVDLHQAVDIRHIATLVDQAKTALFFHKVIGYDTPVVSGIIRSRERAIMG